MQVWETILHRVRQKSHNLQQHAVLKGHYIECNNSGTKEQILNDPTWVESKNAELINQQRTVIRGWRMHEREDLYQLAERFAFQNIKFWLDSVMTNCGCQLGYMWNQLKLKHLDVPVRNVLDCIIGDVRTHSVSVLPLLLAVHIKEHKCRKLWLFACFPWIFPTSSFILLLRHSFTVIRICFLRIPVKSKDQKLCMNSSELQDLLGANTRTFRVTISVRQEGNPVQHNSAANVGSKILEFDTMAVYFRHI